MRLSEANKQTIIACVIAAGVLCVGLWYFQYMFGAGYIKKREKQTGELQAQIRDLEARERLAKQLKQNEQQLLAMEQKVMRIVQRLPRTPDTSQFHQILTDIVSKTGIIPLRVTEKPHVPRQFYTEIPYELECLGRYHDLGELFNLIEENPERLMLIAGFKITNDSQLVEKRPSFHYATVRINCYAYNPDVHSTAAKPAAETPAARGDSRLPARREIPQ